MAKFIPKLNLTVFVFILIYNVKSLTSNLSVSNKNGTSYRYMNYTEMAEFLQTFAEKNKNLTRLYSIGQTHKYKKLWVVEVHNKNRDNDSIRNSAPIPNVKIIGQIHGSEPIGREIIIYLMEYLVKSYYNGDNYIQWLVNNTRIHLLPSLNPDGFEKSKAGVCTPDTRGRGNAHDKNINEDFPDPFRHRNIEIEQPETMAIKNWMNNTPFVLSASLRAGILLVNYPFDSAPNNIKVGEKSLTPETDVFEDLASLYAKTHPTMKSEKCPHVHYEFRSGIVNGASWQRIIGSMQDYNYAVHGCMELTLEIGCCKYPRNEETLLSYWNNNRLALLTFISQVHRGVRGIVTDETGKPIPNAVLEILGRNKKFTTTQNGEFWRILLPENYILEVRASGYDTNISVFEVPKVNNYTMPTDAVITLEIKLFETKNISFPTTEKYNMPNINNSDVISLPNTSSELQTGNFSENESLTKLNNNDDEVNSSMILSKGSHIVFHPVSFLSVFMWYLIL